MKCPTCGRVPSEGCNQLTHRVNYRLRHEDPVWVVEKGSMRIIPSKQRREANRV